MLNNFSKTVSKKLLKTARITTATTTTATIKTDQAWSVRFWQGLSTLLLLTFLVALTASLNGCGFHLRGLDNLGNVQFKTVQLKIDSGVRPEVAQAMRSQLAQSGVELVDSLGAAEVQITLHSTAYSVNRTAHSGRGDATAEFLKMQQSFSAMVVATEESIASGSAQTHRDRQIDPGALMAADRELRSIHREMAEDLVRQMMNRINRAMSKASQNRAPQSTTPTPDAQKISDELDASNASNSTDSTKNRTPTTVPAHLAH